MGFVNDIRRKNVAVKGRLLFLDPLDNNLFWPPHLDSIISTLLTVY